MAFEELTGSQINKFVLADKITIEVHTKEKIFIYRTYGDCCSHSWIEHMDDVPENFTIQNISEKEVSTSDHKGEYEDFLIQYFYEIETDKGSFTIEMRNESNGYYGGSINLESTVLIY